MVNIQLQEEILFKIRKTCLEMLTDRNYKIPDIINDLNYNDFKILFNNKNINLSINKGDNEIDIFVFFQFEDSSFGKNDFKKIINEIHSKFDNNDILIILVLKDKPNNAVRKEILNPKYSNTEIFERKHFMFNVTKHMLVPEHILLSKEEAKKVMETYSCTKEQLPKIYHTDPQVKYHGMKIGDVCKIVRNNKQNGTEISYRIVIAN